MTKAKLFDAVQALDVKAVRAILDARPSLRDARDRADRNPLHLACSVADGDPRPMVRLLLDRGIDIEAVSGKDRCPALFFAVARARNAALVKLLLARGAKVANAPGAGLFAAGWYDDVHILDILVGAGADVNDVADTSVFLACWNWKKFAAARRLVQHGANPNFQDATSGRTALHYGIEREFDPRELRWLVAHGALADIRNRKGITARTLAERKRDKRWLEAIASG